MTPPKPSYERNIFEKAFYKIFKFLDYPHPSEKVGLHFDNKKDFLFLPEIYSTKKHLYWENISSALFFFLIFASSLYIFYSLTGVSILIIISGLIALFYFALMAFKIWIVYESLKTEMIDFTPEEIAPITDEELPVYTILIPLYREEKVIRQILKAMTAIDYPTDKLDIIITLEEYDAPTIEAIKEADMPDYFKTLILPDVKPKTKPKALNVALAKTRGEFFVIYDAEIVPDPDQLKKAYLAFRRYPDIDVFQTRLDHYNKNQSLITRLFNAEFSFYYDMFLPGLQKHNFPLPLSGHSTHFRLQTLKDIGGWDPYNVTEDCEVGMRMYRLQGKSGMINSVSLEEATSDFKSWLLQRTRWMKGFIQTTLVHLRYPTRFWKEIGGAKNFFAFFILVPGSVIVNVLNLVYWVILGLWILTHSSLIQALFPATILYVSMISFICGNLIFTYLNLLGSYRRGNFDLVKYSLLSPIYWIMLALAATRATLQLFWQPHLWEKTTHGTHLETKDKEETKKVPAPAVSLVRE